MTYTPPLSDIRFLLHHVVGLADLLPDGVEAGDIDAVLEEAGKFAANVLAPLNAAGDRQPAKLENGVVRTPEGFADAYRAFVEAGWNGVAANPDYGGQGLGALAMSACTELWSASNMSFGLCPMLTMAAIDCLERHGSLEQKAKYLPRMIEGRWTGAMNLTEAQAGSDLAAIRAKAEKHGDHYLLSGQKIFITFGDHEWSDNVIHLVLARAPGAPPGVKGISLFLAPKYQVNDDGSLGARNDLRAVSLEHKLGIHASPTAVMAFGDRGACYAERIGEENHGLEYMFTMMNSARLNVGIQGVAIAERAYQAARTYAMSRVQGKPIGWSGDGVPSIVFHPDVRRMLAISRAKIEAARALSYEAAAMTDRAHRAVEGAQARVDLLIPIVKAWSTEIGCQVASTGVQIHGGMGFIEETGAAQHYRDARIAPIYEGTNGIQANDLTGRKVLRDGGKAMNALLADIAAVAAADAAGGGMAALTSALRTAHAALARSTQWLLDQAGAPAKAAAVSFTYLELAGAVAGGWMMTRAALAAQAAMADDPTFAPAFARAKLATARIFADHVLSSADGLDRAIRTGADSLLSIDADAL